MMKVTVTNYLNVRIGQPSLNAPNFKYLAPGDIVETDGKLYRGDVFDGNNYWYRDRSDNYYWSGGVNAPFVQLRDRFSDETIFIDFHCHSILKPYSKSFKKKYTAGKNTLKRDKKRSVWYKTKLNLLKKGANGGLTLTKFTQADFTSAYEGGAKVIMVSIDPMERELILSKDRQKKRPIGKAFLDLVQGIGKKRMNYLYDLKDYMKDLHGNLNFLQQLESDPVIIDGQKVEYKLVDLYENMNFSKNVINIIPTIEGAHVFRSSIPKLTDKDEDRKQVLDNIRKVKKNWPVVPFFVAPAHHFKNGLCGQAKSLTGIGGLAYEQFVHPDNSIEELGFDVIRELLKKDYGKRILIDVKHMNLKSRMRYYELLEEEYKNEDIPIIVSHGATNNKSFPNELTNEVNFYKDEIPIIAKSGGVFGVQLDARRLRKVDYGSKRRGLKLIKKRRGRYKRAFFIWRQIEMMALYIYEKQKTEDGYEVVDPWGFQVIGSDFDGVVDPLDGFWTHSEIPLLRENLVLHAQAFLRTKKAATLPDYDDLQAERLVEKFMYTNAISFLSNYFKKENREG